MDLWVQASKLWLGFSYKLLIYLENIIKFSRHIYKVQTNPKFFALLEAQFKLIYMSIHVTINNEIIQKNIHEFVQIIFEGFTYYPLIGRRSVFHSKRHHYPSKSSLLQRLYCICLLVLQIFGDIQTIHLKRNKHRALQQCS